MLKQTPMEQAVILLKTKSSPLDPYEEALNRALLHPTFVPLLEHSFINHEKLIESLASFASNSISGQRPTGIIITSQRAVEAIESAVERLEADGILSPNDSGAAFFDIPVYTVGPSTARAIGRIGFKDIRGGARAGNGGILADLILDESCSSSSCSPARKFIFYTGKIRRDIIPRKLNSHSPAINVTEFEVYQTDTLQDTGIRVQRALENTNPNTWTWLVFFSPSGTLPVVNWLAHNDQNGCMKKLKIASIGPTTRDYLERNKIPCHAMASKPDAQHLVEAILKDGANKTSTLADDV